MPEVKTLAPQANQTTVTEVSVVPDIQTDVNVDGQTTPTATTEAPPDKKMSFSDLQKAMGDTVEEALKPTETIEKPVEPAKTEPVAEEVKTEEQKLDPSVTKNVKSARDLSWADEADRPLFKQMGNEAYAKMRDIYIKSKESAKQLAEKEVALKQAQTGKTVMPESYYEHPEAFVLSPEYNELVTQTQQAVNFERHWQEQLTKVNQDEDWQDIVTNEKGEYVLSEPQAASGRAKTAIIQALQRCNNFRTSKEGELRQFITGYKGRVENLQKFVKADIEERFFGKLFSEESLNKPENAEVKAFYDNSLNAAPPELKNNILLRPLAMAFTTLAQMAKRMNTSSEAAKVAASKKEDASKVQPTAAGMSTGAKMGNGRVVTMDFLEKAMEE